MPKSSVLDHAAGLRLHCECKVAQGGLRDRLNVRQLSVQLPQSIQMLVFADPLVFRIALQC